MNLRKKQIPFAVLAGLLLLPSVASWAQESPTAKSPEQKPGYDQSKDIGTQPPQGADVPFDGTMGSVEKNWTMWPKRDMKITWSIVDAPDGNGKVLMTNGGKKWGTHDLVTKKKYTDFEGHVEFVMMGKRGDDAAEGYANSGVYLQNRFEIQIESPKGKNAKDPYGWKIGPHGIGAFCMEHVPDTNAWRPNGKWQSFHFKFTAAKWDGDKAIAPARATVWWNGIKVHDNVPLKHANGGVPVGPTAEGLKLQEHGQDVRFRNIWIMDRSKTDNNDKAATEKPVKVEVRHSMMGYRDTLVFYHFKTQQAILEMRIDNKDDSFPITGKWHQFDDAVSENGIKKWINNQHSDALFADAAQPQTTVKLKEGFCKVTDSKLKSKSVNPGFQGGAYKDFQVSFTVNSEKLENGEALPALSDTVTVHVADK